MAKQRGLHQIKGKVGEYSYYSQTGVSGGLIRKINEGLSARVKSDAAYANTRLNNLEFGAAANTAALLGQMVTPKFRPMILPFSQSKMAKEILKLARQNVTPWGQRTVASAQTPQIAAILAAQSKRKFSEFARIVPERTSASDLDLYYYLDSAEVDLLISLGANCVYLNAVQYDLATGQFNAITREMSTGYFYKKDSVALLDNQDIESGVGLSGSESMEIETFVPSANHAGHQIIVVVIMPAYNDGTSSHILQELCSFTAFEVPAFAG